MSIAIAAPADRRWRVLFLTADPAQPFASFFGDEELYKFRSDLAAQHRPGHADLAGRHDLQLSTTSDAPSYMFVLAYVQALVGDAPYGLHVLNMVLYLCGVAACSTGWSARRYGGVVALGGLIVLLFLPSLFLWSISVLKEPMNVFVLAGELSCAVHDRARAALVAEGAGAAAGVVALGAGDGEPAQRRSARRRWPARSAALLLAFCCRAAARLLSPLVARARCDRRRWRVRRPCRTRDGESARRGASTTPATSSRRATPIKLVDPLVLQSILRHPAQHAARRRRPLRDRRRSGATSSQPLPWKIESRALLAYLPEQIAVVRLVLLLPFGVVAGLRRDVRAHRDAGRARGRGDPDRGADQRQHRHADSASRRWRCRTWSGCRCWARTTVCAW